MVTMNVMVRVTNEKDEDGDVEIHSSSIGKYGNFMVRVMGDGEDGS